MPQLTFRPTRTGNQLIEEGGAYLIVVVSLAAGLQFYPGMFAAGTQTWAPLTSRAPLATQEAAEAACQQHSDFSQLVTAARDANAAYKEARAAAEAAEEALDAALDALRAAGGSVEDLI